MCTLPVYNLPEDVMDLEPCDLCGGTELRLAYEPADTRKALRVFVCSDCGLVQSLPRRGTSGHSGNREALASGGADWGNIRYGKAFRTGAAVELLRKNLDVNNISRCLDIGSNRGSFVDAFGKVNPNCRFTAVEPDSRVIGEYRDRKGVEVVEGRFEDVELEGGYDLVYCCHTLEHVEGPRELLRKAHDLLAPGGILYLDVPDINIIGGEDFVEEFFIDKHLYHFSPKVMKRLVEAAGFALVKTIDKTCGGDGENIVILAEKPASGELKATVPADALEGETNMALVDGYARNRERNIAALARVGEFINSVGDERVAVWGGGRLFDCLMRHGRVRPGAIALVVDRHLPDHLESVHGFALTRPSDLAENDADHVVIMSRAYADEIRVEAAERLGADCAIHDFTTLMTQPKAAASPRAASNE